MLFRSIPGREGDVGAAYRRREEGRGRGGAHRTRRAVYDGEADHRGAGSERRGGDYAHLDVEGRQDVEPGVSGPFPQSDQRRGALRRLGGDQGGREGGCPEGRGGRHADVQGGGSDEAARTTWRAWG